MGGDVDSSMEDQQERDRLNEAREARKRKILENSSKRLGKITGKKEEEFEKEKEIPIIYPDPDTEPIVEENLQNFNFQSNFGGFNASQGSNPMNDQMFTLLQTMMSNAGGGPTARNRPEEPEVPDNLLVKAIRSRLPIVLLSIIMFIVFYTGNSDLLSGNVFVSLLLWETVEIFILKYFNKLHKKPNPTLQFIVTFAGAPQSLGNIGKIMGTLTKILQDVSVFMLVFIGLHYFLKIQASNL